MQMLQSQNAYSVLMAFKKKLDVFPLYIEEGKREVSPRDVNEYKFKRAALMAFMAAHIPEPLGMKSEVEKEGLVEELLESLLTHPLMKDMRELEDQLAKAFGKTPAEVLMINGGQSQYKVNIHEVKINVGAEKDEALGLSVERAVITDSSLIGSEELLRFVDLKEGAFILSPEGDRCLGKFPQLNQKMNLVVALLNLADRCIYDDGNLAPTELVPNLSAMVDANYQAQLYIQFLKPGACYEIKEVSNKGINKEGFPNLTAGAKLYKNMKELDYVLALLPEGDEKKAVEDKIAKCKEDAKVMPDFEKAVAYVQNVQKTATVMMVNKFHLVVDDQHDDEQPLSWISKFELPTLRVHMVKFGMVRMYQLIGAMKNGGAMKKDVAVLKQAASEIVAYKPAVVCFEGPCNKTSFKDTLYGPCATVPWYQTIQTIVKLAEEETGTTMIVCGQGGWQVPPENIDDNFKGVAHDTNPGGGVHVGCLEGEVRVGAKRKDVLGLALPSTIKVAKKA